MRPLETLLLLASLLTWLTQFVRALRAASWTRAAAPIAVLIAAAQVLVEGPRWQMVPAYALSGLFLLVWLLRGRAPAAARGARSPAGRIVARAGVVLALLGVVGSSALPILVPVFHLPHPTGPYAIGTVTYHWVDSARAEVFTADPNDRRELMVQLWYPARDDPAARRAPYVEHPEALVPLARLFGLPKFIFGHLRYVTTNAIPSAAFADGGPFPVLLFAHGRGGYRQHNTMLAEELVSHGYVVAAVDEPYAASGVVFPDGRLAPFDPRMFDPTHPGHPAFLDSIIPFLAHDFSFALDRLAALNQADPAGVLRGQLDEGRAGMFGVSLGGAVTAEACDMEPRLRACLIMDVFMPADVLRSGLRQPTMWISRDAASMRLEHWKQGDIDETQNGMRTVFARLPGDGYLVLVPGAFHPNFSDFPLLSPSLTRRLGLIGPIDPHRAFTIINTFSVAFFDRSLKGRTVPLLDRPGERFPDVLFESRRPVR